MNITMMKPGTVRNLVLATALTATSLAPLVAQTPTAPAKGSTPKVGEEAPDFSLRSIDGKSVRLSTERTRGPVVLLMMRGFPGYQCPFCTRQFGDYLTNADKLKAAGVTVLFVYPGPEEGLLDNARAFTAGREMPGHFIFLTDPNYLFTNAYGLRWDAPKETAYPATFVLNRNGVVTFAKVSRVHGDRVPVGDVLAALGRQ